MSRPVVPGIRPRRIHVLTRLFFRKGVRHIIPLLLAHSVPNGEENAGDIHVAENAAVEPQQALEAIFGQPKELIEMKVLMMLGLCGSCFQTGEHIQMWASLAQR